MHTQSVGCGRQKLYQENCGRGSQKFDLHRDLGKNTSHQVLSGAADKQSVYSFFQVSASALLVGYTSL